MKTQSASGMNNANSTQTETEDSLLTVPEAAAFLNISVGTVFHWISQKRLPTLHLSARCVRFSKRALLEWLEEKSRPAE